MSDPVDEFVRAAGGGAATADPVDDFVAAAKGTAEPPAPKVISGAFTSQVDPRIRANKVIDTDPQYADIKADPSWRKQVVGDVEGAQVFLDTHDKAVAKSASANPVPLAMYNAGRSAVKGATFGAVDVNKYAPASLAQAADRQARDAPFLGKVGLAAAEGAGMVAPVALLGKAAQLAKVPAVLRAPVAFGGYEAGATAAEGGSAGDVAKAAVHGAAFAALTHAFGAGAEAAVRKMSPEVADAFLTRVANGGVSMAAAGQVLNGPDPEAAARDLILGAGFTAFGTKTQRFGDREAAKPAQEAPPLTLEQAGEVKRDAVDRGVAKPEEVYSPERVATLEQAVALARERGLDQAKTAEAALQALPTTPRPDGSIPGGYEPDALAKGMVEPGAVPAVEKAQAAGVQTVSSGVEGDTGFAIGRAPSGETVRVEAPVPRGTPEGAATPTREEVTPTSAAPTPPPPEAPRAEPASGGESQGGLSIKNADVNARRETRGEQPLERAVPQTEAGWKAEADRQMAENPDKAYRLVEELSKGERPHTPVEAAILAKHQHNLDRALKEYDAEGIAAAKRGDASAAAEAKSKAEKVRVDFLNAAEVASGTSGSEAGRSLRSRQMLAEGQYSRLQIENDLRRANNYDPKTEAADRAEAKQLHDALEKAVADRDAWKARVAELEAQRGVGKAMRGKTPATGANYGKENTVVTREAYEATKAALREKLNRLSAGIDPTILADLAKMGAFHIEAGTRSFAAWAKAMKDDFGEKVVPHLKEVYEEARKSLSEQGISDVSAKMTEGFKEGTRPLENTRQLGKLVEMFVAKGVQNRTELVKAVHEVVSGLDPSVTLRQTRDAISGYGNQTPLNPDPIKAKVRELKGQMQQESKLEDMEGGKAPLKSGPQRQPPGDEQRALIRLVNEAKRKGGYEVRDPEAQLRSALDGFKTRTRHALDDMARQIQSGQKDIPNRTPLQLDAEAKDLKARLDDMRKTYKEVFKTPGLTDAQRVDLAIKATEKSIAEWERRVQTGDVFPAKSESKTPTDPRLEALKATRDALKAQAEDIRATALQGRRAPSEIAAQARKTRMANQLAFLENAVATGNLDKPAKRAPPPLDAEDVATQAKIDTAKRAVEEARIRRDLANQTFKEKFIRNVIAEPMNLVRSLMTSVDVSAVFRQPIFRVLGHPVEAAKNLPDMFRALGNPIPGLVRGGHELAKSDNILKSLWNGLKMAGDAGRAAQARVDAKIRMDPNYNLAKKQGGVFFSEHGDTTLSVREEATASRWSEHIPLLSGSQRAYNVFLNKTRMDAFNALIGAYSEGRTPTPEEVRHIGNAVNIFTGRGSPKDLSTLNVVLWSPQMLASRFKTLAGTPMYAGGSARTKGLMVKEYARFLTGAAVVYGLAKLAGGQVKTDDPRDPDFLKVRFPGQPEAGDTRLDPMGGLLQVTRLVSKVGHTALARAGAVAADALDKDTWGTLGQFLRTKLTPVIGAPINVLMKKNPAGEPATVSSELASLTTPMAMRDLYEAIVAHGIAKGTALGILGLFGMGLQTYKDKEKTKSSKPTVPYRGLHPTPK